MTILLPRRLMTVALALALGVLTSCSGAGKGSVDPDAVEAGTDAALPDAFADVAQANNFSIDLERDRWLRLRISGGPHDGATSNEAWAVRCDTDSYVSVDPSDYGRTTPIEGATSLAYTTVAADKGHRLLIRAEGNDAEFDGFCQQLSTWIVQ